MDRAKFKKVPVNIIFLFFYFSVFVTPNSLFGEELKDRVGKIPKAGWVNVKKARIWKDGSKNQLIITDQKKLLELQSFGANGKIEHMPLSGYGYRISIWHSKGRSDYYNHGGSLGLLPGGLVQYVFVPEKNDFYEWFEKIVAPLRVKK